MESLLPLSHSGSSRAKSKTILSSNGTSVSKASPNSNTASSRGGTKVRRRMPNSQIEAVSSKSAARGKSRASELSSRPGQNVGRTVHNVRSNNSRPIAASNNKLGSNGRDRINGAPITSKAAATLGLNVLGSCNASNMAHGNCVAR